MDEQRQPTDFRSIGVWWLGTWIFGVVAASIVSVAFFSPEPFESGTAVGGRRVYGDVLGVPLGILAASLVVLWSVHLAGMWVASSRVGTGDVVRDYSVRFKPVDLIGVPIGVAAQLGLVPLVYLPLRSAWPDTFDTDALSETASDLVDRAPGSLILVLVALVVVGAPVVEELFFRGMLQHRLLLAMTARGQQVGAVVGVAAVFALIHFRPVEFPGLFAFGLVLGACAWRTGRLGMAIAAHVAFNAAGLVSVL